MIGAKIRDAQLGDTAAYQVVVTGGGSALPGLPQMMGQALGGRLRTGAPNGSVDMPGELRSPVYSTAIGMLLWAMSNPMQASEQNSTRQTLEMARLAYLYRFFRKFRVPNLLRNLLGT